MTKTRSVTVLKLVEAKFESLAFGLFEEQLDRPFVFSRLEIGVELMSLSVAMLAQGK